MSDKNVLVINENNLQNIEDNDGYSAFEGLGFEGVTSDDLSIPYIKLLQSNSPELANDERLKSGMMYNPVTKEAFNADTGFVFQPCYMEHIFAEWPAEGETGPVIGHPYAQYLNTYLSLPFHINKSGVVTTSREGPDKHVFTDTYQVYGMFLADDGVTSTGFGILSFSKTKIKAYKDWCTSLFSVQCNKVTPPLFANRARFTAVKKTNAKGTFYVYKIEPFKETWVKSLIDPRTERHLLIKGKEIMDNAINEKKKFGNIVVGVNDADELDPTSSDVPF